MSRYQIQMLDGYTDGRPSWRKTNPWPLVPLSSKEAAEEAARKLREEHPSRKYRVRKVK